jgi:hypothetical protein
MQKYVRKPEVVEAVQFTTNNEPDNAQMNAIVEWVRGQRGAIARHDGTDIYVTNRSGRDVRISVGDWIVSKDGYLSYPVKPSVFAESFEPCGHLWEAVDDSDYDQCLVCGDTRPFEMHYFGDEVL